MDENKTIDLVPAFDFGSINEQHQSAAKEISGWLKSLGLTEVSEEILRRYKIDPIPSYNLDESEFYQLATKAGFYVAGQGTLIEGEGKDKIQIPLVAISGDIRKLNDFINIVKNS